MKRHAFTMLELVFVILVISILAVLGIPSFQKNLLQEATEQIAGHIRYTQHLAYLDDKYDLNDTNWRAENWQIWFRIYQGSYYYEVFSDKNHGANSNADEEAIDPISHDKLGNGISGIGLPQNQRMNLTETYGITMMSFSQNCAAGQGGQIAFDNIGRPYGDVTYDPNDPYYKLFKEPCIIQLHHEDTDMNSTISIYPETGYVLVKFD